MKLFKTHSNKIIKCNYFVIEYLNEGLLDFILFFVNLGQTLMICQSGFFFMSCGKNFHCKETERIKLSFY